MKLKILKKSFKYNGAQLSSDFSYFIGMKNTNVIAWSGSANVKEHLVDLEDVKNNDYIKSDDMLHFIITIRGNNIREAVLWQRLFMNVIGQYLQKKPFFKNVIKIEGDDIMVCEDNVWGKLSVSIATVSLTKELIHIGLNWKAGLAPVITFSLDKYKSFISKEVLLQEICNEINETYKSVKRAEFKVKVL